jgi:hypothetical protein
VYLSIDGDRESHDQYRKYRNGRGSYDDVVSSLTLLKARKNIHIIGSSVIREGFSLREAMSFLEQHGADTCKAERVRLDDGAPGALAGQNHELYLRDTRDLVNHYIQAISASRKPMDFRLTPKMYQVHVQNAKPEFFGRSGDQAQNSGSTEYPRRTIVLRPRRNHAVAATVPAVGRSTQRTQSVTYAALRQKN